MNTVYPLDQVDSGLVKKLSEDHPQALIVFHPAFERWLLFESPKGSRWTAEMLYEAMREHHSKVVRGYPYATPKWVNDLGAPVMRDELPRRPGSWLLEWLNKNDLWRHPGGAKDWLKSIEEDERYHEQEALNKVEDMNHEAAYESTMPLHMADVLRGDTIFRKWRATAPALKKEGSRARKDKVRKSRQRTVRTQARPRTPR